MMASPATEWWIEVEGPRLAQGDYLPDCRVPFFNPDYGDADGTNDVLVKEYNCVVLTQSCYLEQNKTELVALCPIFSIDEFEEINPTFRNKGGWERVRQGRVEGLHLLASPAKPNENRAALVANFREVYSLPVEYLRLHAAALGSRRRLASPFLEHFSQAFARFFMRVGLPSAIPPFR